MRVVTSAIRVSKAMNYTRFIQLMPHLVTSMSVYLQSRYGSYTATVSLMRQRSLSVIITVFWETTEMPEPNLILRILQRLSRFGSVRTPTFHDFVA